MAICVITLRRPDGLRRLIESLTTLTFPTHPARIELIIVSNDADQNLDALSADLRRLTDLPLRCAIEPRRGIPFARNRSVALVPEEADFALFVDDDETVTPNWLDELLRVQAEHNADVVAGPVVPHFMQTPPDWIIRGRFLELHRHHTGATIDRAFTGNALVRTTVLRNMSPPFDERLALTGGSDTHFFRRVHAAGYHMVWADEAIAYDWVPPSRITTHWILQRAYRYGVNTPLIEKAVGRASLVVPRTALIGVYRILKGTIFLLPSLFLGRHQVVTYLRHICYGAGMLAGLCGSRYDEYQRTHGT